MKPRLVDLDLAKGIAIFLVVLAHLVSSPAEAPAGNEWYMIITRLVYMFHMPFFMFVSGAVFYYTLPDMKSASDYCRYISRRAFRLLPAFFLFSIVIFGAKEAGRHFLHVDNPSNSGLTALAQIAVRPGESFAKSLWYIYVLFQFHVIFPPLLHILRGSQLGLLAVITAIHALTHFVTVPTLFAMNQVCEYALHFGLGFLLIRHYSKFMEWLNDNVILAVGVFLASFLSMHFLAYYSAKTAIGLASLPAVLGIAASIRGRNDRRILSVLNEYTFTIYLMNTLFIGLTKGLLLKLTPWDGNWFLLYFPTLLASGIIGPIALHRLVLTKVPVLGRITK